MCSSTNNMIEKFLSLKAPHTQRAYRATLRLFLAFIKKDILLVNPQDGLDYVAHLKARGCAMGTIKRHFYSIYKVFEFLTDHEMVSKNPLRVIKGSVASLRGDFVRPTAVITRDEAKRMLELVVEKKRKDWQRDEAMLATLFYTGLRRSELLALKASDIRARNGKRYFFIAHSKNHKTRNQPINAELWRYLLPHLETVDVNGRIFDISETLLFRRFKYYAALIGIKAGPHAARATFATTLKEDGAEDRAVATALGHSGINMVQVYDKRTNLEDCAFDLRL